MTRQIRWLTVVLAIIAAGGALFGAGPSATARFQDETESEAESVTEATPAITSPSACAVPNSDTGDGTDIETPFGAGPAATPVAEDNAADPAATAALDQLVRAVAACLSNGEHEAVADLVTERFLGQLYGGGAPLSREDYLFLATDLPTVPFQIRSLAGIELTPDAAGASADVLYVVGSELVHARWDFVPAEMGTSGRWLVDAETALPVAPPDGTSTVGIRLDEYTYRLETRETAGPAVVLRGSNAGEEEHELLVLRLGPGLSTEDLLLQPGPALPEGVTFVGQVTIPAGEEADLVLVDLAPGSYVIVCLLPDAEGTPHLALGMRTRLTIT